MFRAWKFWQGAEPEPWPALAEDSTKPALLADLGHGRGDRGDKPALKQ